MDLASFARAVFALGVTLGLLGLAAWAFRRFGPDAVARLSAQRRERRLQVIESLLLDPQRRLVLVREGTSQHLLLLGEGRLLTSGDYVPPPPPPEGAAPAAPADPWAPTRAVLARYFGGRR